MRLLLDAHLSGRRVASALRDRGHDVRALDEERAPDGWTDEAVLALAAEEQRILVACDVKDFARITRVWAEAGRKHAGCALLVGIDHAAFGSILRAIEAAFAARPEPGARLDHTAFVLPRR